MIKEAILYKIESQAPKKTHKGRNVIKKSDYSEKDKHVLWPLYQTNANIKQRRNLPCVSFFF